MRHYYYTSKKNGMDLICNVCGDTEFLKRLEGLEYIGGRIKPERYEEPRKGWVCTPDREDICPECNEYFTKEDES